MATTAVLLPVQGEPQEITIGDWKDLGRAVGGWIERAPTPGAPFTLYVNEEGKLDGLPLNVRANRLANRYRYWNDPLVGDAVLVGPPTPAGDDTDFTLAEYEDLLS